MAVGAHPTRAAVAAAALLVATASCGGVDRQGPAIQGKRPAPDIMLSPGSSGPLVVWIVRAEDCLSCQSPVGELRRLARQFGSAVLVVVLAVDDGRDVVRAFVRNERLDAEVRAVDGRAYRRAFGSSPLPALYIVERDTIVATALLGSVRWNVPEGRERLTLDQAVQRLLHVDRP